MKRRTRAQAGCSLVNNQQLGAFAPFCRWGMCPRGVPRKGRPRQASSGGLLHLRSPRSLFLPQCTAAIWFALHHSQHRDEERAEQEEQKGGKKNRSRRRPARIRGVAPRPNLSPITPHLQVERIVSSKRGLYEVKWTGYEKVW